jgi:ligand-binding sensor domain-containing protein
VTSFVNSNDVAAVTAWQGALALGTSGGLVLYSPATGTFQKILRTPAGLPSNDVLCLAVTASGSLWAGTADAGIARLRPGGGFRRTLRSFDGLPSDRVQTLYVREDSVWVGTAGGVALFTESAATGQATLRRVDTGATTAGGLVSDRINAFQLVGDTLWTATDAGLSTFAGGAWAPRAPLLGSVVRSLALLQDTLWAATAAGPARYAAGAFTTVTGGHPGGSLRLVPDGSGLLSACSASSVFRYAAGAWSELGANAPRPQARGLFRDESGTLWAGTRIGLARYDAPVDAWSVAASDGPAIDAFTPPSVRAAVDGRGLWISTGNASGPAGEHGAAVHYDGRSWSILWSGTTNGQMQNASLFGLLSDRGGRLWFGHCCSGGLPLPRLDRWDPVTGTWDTPTATNILSLAQTPSGRVYAAGVEFGNGIYEFDAASGALLDSLTPANTQGGTGTGLTSNIIRAIAFDARGKAWIALRDRGLDIWDGRGTAGRGDDVWTHVEGGLPSSATLSLAVESPARAWLGTTVGLAQIEGTAVARIWTLFTQPPLPAPQVNDLALDAGGNLWIATSAGLGLLSPDGSLDVLTTQDGLVDDNVASIAWDAAAGALWVATARGVSRVVLANPQGPGFSPATYLYPNPVRGPGGALRLGGLDNAIEGEIRDPAGRLVHRFRADPVSDQIWDLTRADGGPAASGIYLVLLRGHGATRMLRVAVLR